MNVNKVLGLEQEVIADNESSYGWWLYGEPITESKGFELSVYFPRWPVGLLPAVVVQAWSYRVQIGWFF